jgi:hypothetical protein
MGLMADTEWRWDTFEGVPFTDRAWGCVVGTTQYLITQAGKNFHASHKLHGVAMAARFLNDGQPFKSREAAAKACNDHAAAQVN